MSDQEPPVEHKRIYTVAIFTRDDPETQGQILKGQAIEHEGQLWLVPLWLDHPDKGWSIPARIINLSAPPLGVQLQETAGMEGMDYLLNYPLPIADLRNETAPEIEHEFEVIERPAIKVARPH